MGHCNGLKVNMCFRQKSFMVHVAMMLVCRVIKTMMQASFNASRGASNALETSSHALEALTMCIIRPVVARERFLREF